MSLCVAVALAVWTGPLPLGAADSHTLTVAGVELPTSISLAGKTVLLNGAGVRKKAVFKVYVGALYLESKATSAEAALAESGPNRLIMRMLRDVGRDHLVEAFNEGFANNSPPPQVSELKARIDQFDSYIADTREGDVMTFDYLPSTGTEVRIKGKLAGTISGADFNSALLRVWLGPKPPSTDLKLSLLGG